MADVVDSIVSELQVDLSNYRRGYLEAIDLNKGLDKAEADLDAKRKARAAAAGSPVAAQKKAAQDVAQTEEQADQRITRSRKKRTDDEIAAAERSKIAEKDRVNAIKQSVRDEAAAVKAAEKEKQAAIAETAKARSAAERRASRTAPAPVIVTGGTGQNADHGPHSTPVPASSGLTEAEAARLAPFYANRSKGPNLESDANVAAEKDINNALIQRVELQERLKVANEQDAVAIRAQLTEINLATAYERAGLEAKEAALRLDRELAVIEEQRAKRAAVQSAKGAAGADLYDLRARASVAPKEEAGSYRDQIDLIQRRNAYIRAGLNDQEIAERIARETAAIEERRIGIAAEQTAMIEKQMRAQQGAIANKISGTGLMIGGLAGAAGAAEISHLNDEYIKLQNTLRVAGVSTQDFATVQNRLLATANRTGTDINALADVYRGAALASHDLGASQTDLLKITDAAANALRIQGRSSSEAQGALLQLGHAFESGRVTAREFNSLALNLYPILQAVAKGSDQWGGSVAKLRADLVGGTVTSREFFQALLKGSDDLADRAAKATLTTAQGFNALRNSLIVYFGEADKAQGVSAALGAALQKLGENLDTLIPAIAAVATALTVGYITRLTAAAIATRGLGASILGAFGGPVGLAITTVTVALASFAAEANRTAALVKQTDEAYAELQDRLKATSGNASVAGNGIKGVGTDALGAIPHVNNFAGAVGNLAQQLYNQARAARAARVEMLQQQLQASQQKETELASKTPAGAAGELQGGASALSRGNFARSAAAVRNFISNRLGNLVTGGDQDRNVQRAYGEQVKISQDLQKQIAQAKSAPITADDIPGGAPGSDNPNRARIDKLQKEIDDLKKIEGGTSGKRRASIDRQIERRQQQIDALADGASPSAAKAATYVPGAGGRGKSAETLQNEETERQKRFSDQLAQIHERYLSAQTQLTVGTDKQLGDQEKAIIAQRGKQDADYRYQEKLGQLGKGAADILSKQNDEAAAEDLKVIALKRQVQAYDEGTAAIQRQNQLHDELLQTQAAFAKTSSERLAIELERIDAEKENTKNLAIRTILSPNPNVTDQQRIDAGAALSSADDRANQKKAVARHENMAPWADFVDKLPSTAKQVNEQFQQAAVNGVQALNSSLDQTISKTLHLHGVLGQIVSDFIMVAIKSEEAKLFGGSGGGGGLGGIFGSIAGLFGGGFGASIAGTNAGIGDMLSASNTAGFGSILSGFRANGGPVDANGTYLVGERGPELLRMGAQGGTVIPNHAIAIAPNNQAVRSATGYASQPPIEIRVQANDYFDAKVHGIAAAHADQAAVRGAVGGDRMSAERQARANRRKLA